MFAVTKLFSIKNKSAVMGGVCELPPQGSLPRCRDVEPWEGTTGTFCFLQVWGRGGFEDKDSGRRLVF